MIYNQCTLQVIVITCITKVSNDDYLIKKYVRFQLLCNSYTMGCPPVRGDNPRALASGLSYVQVDKNCITILYHLHQC